MTKRKLRERLAKLVRKEKCTISGTQTIAKIAKSVGCTKEELDEFIKEEYNMSFSTWKQDPGIVLGYPTCESCGKHRRGRPFGRRGEVYQCLVCGNIGEKRKLKYNTNGTVNISEQTPISLPTLRGR
jgi:hypothetical protein